MQDVQPTESTPWHKHRMLWLVIGIPAATVLGCLLTIYLAVSNPDQHVSSVTPASHMAGD